MLRPSYNDLIEAVNSDIEPGEQPVVQSRYSIVIAASKRARQLIDGAEPLVGGAYGKKPLSVAVDELYKGKVKILTEAEAAAQALDAEETLEELEELDMDTEASMEQLEDELGEFDEEIVDEDEMPSKE